MDNNEIYNAAKGEVHFATHWNRAMYGASQGGHLDIVKLMIEKGANDWNWGMLCAAEGGHLDLVKFFIEKGATLFNLGMEGAAHGGHLDLVNFFIEKGANDWGTWSAALGGHLELVNFFIEKGATDWNRGMEGAAQGGHPDTVKFIRNKYFDECIQKNRLPDKSEYYTKNDYKIFYNEHCKNNVDCLDIIDDVKFTICEFLYL